MIGLGSDINERKVRRKMSKWRRRRKISKNKKCQNENYSKVQSKLSKLKLKQSSTKNVRTKTRAKWKLEQGLTKMTKWNHSKVQQKMWKWKGRTRVDCSNVQFPSSLKPRSTALLPQAAPTSSMINKTSFAAFSQVQRCFKAKLGDTTRKIYTAAPTSSMILQLMISFAAFSQFKRNFKVGWYKEDLYGLLLQAALGSSTIYSGRPLHSDLT